MIQAIMAISELSMVRLGSKAHLELAVNFHGAVTDYVKVNNSVNLQVVGDLTISCWVYFYTLSTKQTLIYKSWNGEYELSMNGAAGTLEFDHNGSRIYSPTSSVKSGVWSQIVCVRNITAMTVTFYVNGLQVGTSQSFTKLPTVSSNALFFGQENGYNPIRGSIDDVRIYDRTLSSNEIAKLYILGEIPDRTAFSDYYNFIDSITNNSMLIYANSSGGANDSVINCTSFFVDDTLAFQSNDTIDINIWD